METPSLKKNLFLLIVLTLSGSFICSLPWFRSYYYAPFMEAFGMTNTEMGLCGTALGVAGIAAYLFGGIICDHVSIKILIPFAMISTGALGLVMLANPSPHADDRDSRTLCHYGTDVLFSGPDKDGPVPGFLQ